MEDTETACKLAQLRDAESCTIRVWFWEDAPPAFRGLSTHGGDEDFVAHVPRPLIDRYIPWLEQGPFGCCSISEHELLDGSKVFIGAHA